MRRFLLIGLLLGSGCEEGTFIEAQALLEATPPRLDFGDVQLTQQVSQSLQVTNVGARDAEVSVRVIDDCGGCFRFSTVDRLEIVPQQVVDLDLAFRPSREGVATATLTFTALQDEVVPFTVSARGNGVDGRRPDVRVDPEVIDFGGGVIPSGQPALDSFVIRSTGESDLLVDAIRIEPPNGPYAVTTSTPTPDQPGRLAPGREASFTIRALIPPGATSTQSAAVLIDTNVLEEKNVPGVPGRVRVPITSVGNAAPVARIFAPQFVEPFSRVDVDGSGSFDPDDPPDLPLSYRWQLTDAPPGSQARLQSSSGDASAFFADITGPYTLRLTVTDALGLVGTETAIVEARPEQGIRIELIWDHPDSDVDLHLIRQGGQFCDCAGGADGAPSDVHYRCRQPNWYPDFPGANPFQDVDDRNGFGPEVITLRGDGPEQFIPSDSFRIEVHYYDDKERLSSFPTTISNATVRVFLFGAKVAEYDRALEKTGIRWIVADIDWPSGELTEVDQAFDGFECGIF